MGITLANKQGFSFDIVAHQFQNVLLNSVTLWIIIIIIILQWSMNTCVCGAHTCTCMNTQELINTSSYNYTNVSHHNVVQFEQYILFLYLYIINRARISRMINPNWYLKILLIVDCTSKLFLFDHQMGGVSCINYSTGFQLIWESQPIRSHL